MRRKLNQSAKQESLLLLHWEIGSRDARRNLWLIRIDRKEVRYFINRLENKMDLRLERTSYYIGRCMWSLVKKGDSKSCSKLYDILSFVLFQTKAHEHWYFGSWMSLAWIKNLTLKNDCMWVLVNKGSHIQLQMMLQTDIDILGL